MLIIHGITGGIGSELYKHAVDNVDMPVFATERKDIQLDDPDSVHRFYNNLPGITPTPGEPYYVINATGVCEPGFLTKTTNASYQRQRSVLLDGNFYLAREFAHRTPPGSSLLLLSSVVHRQAVPGTVVYALCKAALAGLVKTAAVEMQRKKQRINAIEMGYFNTGMITLVPEERRQALKKAGHLGQTEQLWTVCWETLRNNFVSGAMLPVTGGL